jgi:hypothetical protein
MSYVDLQCELPGGQASARLFTCQRFVNRQDKNLFGGGGSLLEFEGGSE